MRHLFNHPLLGPSAMVDRSALDAAPELDSTLLTAEGRIRILPASTYRGLEPAQFRAWCHLRARYGIPTAELVTWLFAAIGGRRALEIGAGNGDLGYILGIPSTDSYQQVRNPQVAAYYRAINQPPTRPPTDVLEMEALAAVRHFRPQVVVGCWVTHQADNGPGNTWGVREAEILPLVETYIHIGHREIHRHKPILALPHEEVTEPWLVSRAANRWDNVIQIWGPHRQPERSKP